MSKPTVRILVKYSPMFGQKYCSIRIEDRAKELKCEKHYDQIWCVFDKDDFSDNDFNYAIHLANKLNFYTAYSNQAFEYWLILHFDDHQGGGIHGSPPKSEQ